MDVTGRNGHYDDALQLYATMRAGRNQPNVVTFITLIRVLAGWHSVSQPSARARASASHDKSSGGGCGGDGRAWADVLRAKETILQLLHEAEDLAEGGKKEEEREGSEAGVGAGEGAGTGAGLSSPHCSTTGAAPTVFVTDSNGRLEVSVYNAALAGFVKFRDFERFVLVLQSMRAKGVEGSSITLDIICKFFYLHYCLEGGAKQLQEMNPHLHQKNVSATNGTTPPTFVDIDSYGCYLVGEGGISSHTAGLLAGNLHAYLERKKNSQNPNNQHNKSNNTNNHSGQPAVNAKSAGGGGEEEKPNYTGCLGKDAPSSMRESVVAHDMDKLLQRLTPLDSSQLHESDFVTLLHQCRKRKWSDQIATVIRGMRVVSTEGVVLPGQAGKRPIPPFSFPVLSTAPDLLRCCCHDLYFVTILCGFCDRYPPATRSCPFSAGL